MSAGTAFALAYVDVVYLVTAAHIAPGVTPTTRWDEWAPEFTAVLEDRSLTIRLFASDGRSRTPLFGHRATTDGSGRMADLMWVALPDAAVSMLAEARIAIHDTPPPFVEPGAAISAFGFPLSNDPWPGPVASTAGETLGMSDLILEAQMATEEGLSGGPVLRADGQLVGMVIGETDDRARIVPAFVIATFISDSIVGKS